VLTREPEWNFQPSDGQSVAFLLYEEQHHVPTQSQSWRTVRRLMTHAAVQALSQVELEFDPAAAHLLVHELAVWRQEPDGAWQKRTLAQPDAFLLRQREQQLEQQMLNGRVSLVALMEDVRVGDVIDMAWTLEPCEVLPGLRFTAFHASVWSVPVARATFALVHDGELPPSWRMHAPPEIAPPRREESDGRIEWTIENPPVFVSEPNASPCHWPFAFLEVTGWSRWGEVAEFVSRLWADALADNAEAVQAEARRLAEGRAPAAAVLAAIRFVQSEVRYLAVDFGHGAGMLPNGAGTVLRRRFGDCKDKTVLLTALLRVLGVEASPFLVAANWREAVARLQPSTAVFSHVIVTFQFDGQRHFVDPTILGQGGDLGRMVTPPFGCGLEIRSGVTQLEAMPSPLQAGLDLTETFHLDTKHRNGSVQQVLRATGWLADEVRAALARQGNSAFFKTRADVLRKNFPALAPSDGSGGTIQDDSEANVIELRQTLGLPTWGTAGQPPPKVFTYGAYGLGLVIEPWEPTEQRRQAWALRHPLAVRHRVIVQGKTVRRLQPERYRIEEPGFRYTCDVTSRRHEAVFDYHWQSTAALVTPEQWPEYCRQRTLASQRMGANVLTVSQWTLTGGRGAIWAAVIVAALVMVGAIVDGTRRSRGFHAPAPSRNDLVRMENELRAAAEQVARGQHEAAEPVIERVAPYFTRSFNYHILRAEVALRRGRFAQVQDSLRSARSLDAANIAPDLIEAQSRERQGNLSGAREILSSALARSPEEPRVLFALASLASRMRDAPAALPLWEKFLARYPANPDGLLQYCLLLWGAGQQERADAVMFGTLKAQPTPSGLLEAALCDYLSATGRFAEAVAPARRAAGLLPADSTMAFRLVMAVARTGDKPAALEEARAMVKRFPGQPNALNAWATVAAVSGSIPEAEEAFQALFAAAPQDGDARGGYGFFLHRTGRTQQARAVLEQAARDFPGSGIVWMNYGVVLQALGETQAAAVAQQRATALMPKAQVDTLLR
jgi:tetratricopeptide (TPR) repeat protein